MAKLALSPEALAHHSAAHPWATITVWLVALGVSLGLTVALLGGVLTTEIRFTNEPEAIQAANLLRERFVSEVESQESTQIVLVRSAERSVEDPAFRAFVESVFDEVLALGPEVVTGGVHFYQLRLPALVSLDRMTTGLVFTLVDDPEERANLRAFHEVVDRAHDREGFEVHSIEPPAAAGRSEAVMVRSLDRTVDDPAFQQFVEDLFFDIVALGHDVVRQAITYYQSGEESQVSADRHTTIIPVGLWDPLEVDHLIEVVERARESGGFEVLIAGQATVDRDFQELSESDLTKGELLFGLPAAAVVLLLVFGAVVAALIPLALAFVSIAIALGLASLIGQAFELSIFLVNMVVMMGLAVGIDYCLFIIARYREERARGLDTVDAIQRAGATASRAVLFSGITVVLALIGMLLVPVTLFTSLGLGAILVVVVSVAASLTLLPAVLRLLGDRVDALRLPFVSWARIGSGEERSGFWDRISRVVMRAPLVSIVLGAGLLVAAAIPLLDIRTGAQGVSSFPDAFESKRGFLLLEQEFSAGLVYPTVIAVDGPIDDPAVRQAVDALKDALGRDAAFGAVSEEISAGRDTARLSVPIAGGEATSDAAISAVKRLRNDYIPAAFEGVPARALVTGETAGNLDWFKVANDAAPVVLPFVLVLSFLLLMVAFRSIVVPVKAVVMNLLSVGAAYGLLVLVFQKGVGTELLGFQRADTIEVWIPVFLFSVLFGLSMDYHVFLLSRIRERFGETQDNAESVAFGLRSTGRLITGAALIMVAVFGGFASGDLVMFQQMGFGLAVAVLLDATLVRTVLVPASMRLLGHWNWYLPRFLEWLPNVSVEGARPASVPAGAPGEEAGS